MATKIGFKLQDKAIVPDASALFDLSDTLLAQEDKREKQRQTWRDEQDALRKSQRDLTPTANQNANQFFGKFSQGIMDVSTTLQKQLETGLINSSDYAAQWRNLNQSNEQMIAAQTSYQKTAQQIADDVASGKSSEVNTANLNHFNKVFQPGAMEVERDGRGGLKLFNKETGDIVSPSYLSDLTNGNLPKYDYSTVAKNLVDQFGKRGITEGSGKTITGVYANMSGEELDTIMQDEAKALLAGAQAPTVSILVDGMGYNVVYNEKDLKPGSVYRKPDGTFGFAEGDEQKAVDFMAGELRKALPREVKERQELTEKEEVSANQKQQQLDETNRANVAREKAQALRDKKANAKAGDVIFADPNEAFEAYIVDDEKLTEDTEGSFSGVNADILSIEIPDAGFGNNEKVNAQVIDPLLKKFGPLGFSFELDTSAFSDSFMLVGPSGGEGIKIKYDQNKADGDTEYQKMLRFIRAEYVDPNVLQSKYSVIGYDRFGPGSVFVDASGRPISQTDSTGNVVDYSQK